MSGRWLRNMSPLDLHSFLASLNVNIIRFVTQRKTVLSSPCTLTTTLYFDKKNDLQNQQQ